MHVTVPEDKKMQRAILAAALCIGLLFGAMPADAIEWEPISQITEYELHIIEEVTRESPLNHIRRTGATAFFSRRGLVVLLTRDSDVAYYGTNRKLTNNSSGDGRREEEKSREMPHDKFKKIWDVYSNYNLITQSELDEADRYVDEFVELARRDPEKLTHLYVFMNRGGNRYLHRLLPLVESAPIATKIDFWDFYISSTYTRTADKPSDEERRTAIQTLRQLIETNGKKYRAGISSLSIIEKLDIETFRWIVREVKQNHVDTSTETLSP